MIQYIVLYRYKYIKTNKNAYYSPFFSLRNPRVSFLNPCRFFSEFLSRFYLALATKYYLLFLSILFYGADTVLNLFFNIIILV
jgi:hypothetical protein